MPVYRQIAQQITAWAAESEIPRGQKMPSINQMAKDVGVSTRTACQAVRHLVEEDICYVKARRGVYATGRYGRSRLQGSSQIVKPRNDRPLAIVVCGGNQDVCINRDLINYTLMCEIRVRARQYHANVLLIDRLEDLSLTLESIGDRMQVLGCVLIGIEHFHPLVDLAPTMPDLNFIYLDYHMPKFSQTGNNVHGIFNDNFSGGYQVAIHLLNSGHRRFGAVSIKEDTLNYAERIEGFRAGLKTSGLSLPASACLVGERESLSDQRGFGREAMRALVENQGHDLAVFCVNDQLAQGAASFASEVGIKPTIFGHDGVLPQSEGAEDCHTVLVDLPQISHRAVDATLSSSNMFPKIIRVEPSLVVRQTAQTMEPAEFAEKSA